jgi:heptosyltransferase-2
MLQIPIERPHFFGNPRSEEQARAILGAFDRVKVGLNPSAGTRWPSKSLRLAEAIRLVDALKRHGVTCLLLGGRDDAEYLEKLASATGAPVINNLPLAVFAGVIRGLDLLTTSDTLALHLAIAQAVPNLSYYAPTSAAEINTFGTGSKVASTSADYCSYKPDADNSTITAGRLLPEALKLLTIPSARPHR